MTTHGYMLDPWTWTQYFYLDGYCIATTVRDFHQLPQQPYVLQKIVIEEVRATIHIYCTTPPPPSMELTWLERETLKIKTPRAKVQVIKSVRLRTGKGLKECYDFVTEQQQKGGST